MDLIILDPTDRTRLIKKRRKYGLDRFDEVWEGVYVMSPLADDEHQAVGTKLSTCFEMAIGMLDLGEVRAGSNVSDRVEGWRQNYRCPDVAVYLNGTTAELHGAFWKGGPDFAVEVVSQYDRSRQKFDFYAAINTRELLIVDRYPWVLELYRLNEAGYYDLVGRSTVKQPDLLTSVVMPLTFQLQAGEKRPRIAIAHNDGLQTWLA